jgi:hypothetical protein
MPWGCGRGRAWGGGRNRGWNGFAGPVYGSAAFFAAWGPEQEVVFLQNQSAALEQEIKRIRSRIDELESKGEQK